MLFRSIRERDEAQAQVAAWLSAHLCPMSEERSRLLYECAENAAAAARRHDAEVVAKALKEAIDYIGCGKCPCHSMLAELAAERTP